MAAATSTTVFAVDSILGVDVGAKSSTPAHRLLTSFQCSDGKRWLYVRASEAIGSIETIKIGAAGSASTDAGSAGFTTNAPGGLTAGQYGWARKTSL